MSKVLIIDDDLFYRKIFKKKFEVSGYEADAAENGREGLEKLKSFQPDIVFVDLMMPEMDGFHFLEQAKADPTTAHVPVVVLTNLSTTDDAQKVLDKGALAILVKSDSEPHIVIDKANEILGKTGGEA